MTCSAPARRGLRVVALALALALVLGGCSAWDGGQGDRAATVSTAEPQATPPVAPVLSGFVAFGDFGGGPRQHAVARAMERWAAAGHRVDALVTTGDNVYTEGDPRLFGAQLDEPYRTLRRGRPLWATLGNHDVRGGHGAEQLRYLGLPPLPYARRLPGVELAFLDGNRPDREQAEWLEQWLRAPGAAFRVVVFHQPAWSCGPHGSTERVGRLWVPVLERHRVALVLNGHDHNYQRFASRGGVTYVVTGGGGRGLYRVATRCARVPPRKAWAERHHFTAVEVRAGSLTLTAVADDGEVLDRAVLRRPA